MANYSESMPVSVSDALEETIDAMAKGGGTSDRNSSKEISIKFGKGLVGEPFTSRRGTTLVEVKIPNEDAKDRSPWASFVISPKMIHDNKYGKGVWMKLPADETIRIGKPFLEGKSPEGKNIWKRDYSEISVTELKSMLESYKRKERSSVLGNLDRKKDAAKRQPSQENRTQTAERNKSAGITL